MTRSVIEPSTHYANGPIKPGIPHSENKRMEKRDKYREFAREQKQTMEQDGDGDINFNWCSWNNPLWMGKGT